MAVDKKERLGFKDNLSNEKFFLLNRFIKYINSTSLWIVCFLLAQLSKIHFHRLLRFFYKAKVYNLLCNGNLCLLILT